MIVGTEIVTTYGGPAQNVGILVPGKMRDDGGDDPTIRHNR